MGAAVTRGWLAGCALAVCAVFAACSVPGLDLSTKSCPCSDGYTCVANRCVATGDGAVAASCLGGTPGALLYSDDFDGATIDAGWTTSASWAQLGGELVQSDAADQLAVAYTTHVTTSSYRVTVVIATAGGTGAGIAVRLPIGTRTQYDCVWQPGSPGMLLWQATNNGGQATTLATPVAVDNGGQTTATMEVTAIGSELRCCLDQVPGAVAAVSNPTPNYASGQPGMMTNRMRASFDHFAAYAN
jgi:hypothetical protein